MCIQTKKLTSKIDIPNDPESESDVDNEENLSAKFQVLSDGDEFHNEDDDISIDQPEPSKKKTIVYYNFVNPFKILFI